jgi:hypothetical protein
MIALRVFMITSSAANFGIVKNKQLPGYTAIDTSAAGQRLTDCSALSRSAAETSYR